MSLIIKNAIVCILHNNLNIIAFVKQQGKVQITDRDNIFLKLYFLVGEYIHKIK